MNRVSVLLIAAIALLPAIGAAQLTRRERDALDKALFLGDIAARDLGFEKKQDHDPYRLPINALALDDPLLAADSLMQLHEMAHGTLAEVLEAGCRSIYHDPKLQPEPAVSVTAPREVPEKLRAPLADLIGDIAEANNHVRSALKRLNEKERRELIEGLPQWAAGSEVRFGFVKTPANVPGRLLDLLKRVDLAEIRSAGLRLSNQVEAALPTWRTLATRVRLRGTLRFRVDSVTVELSGQGDDEHSTLDSSLCIDLGGKNQYMGRYGAGIGYASVLIDCGESSFDVPDLSIGAGLLGIGLAYELGGHADFRGRSLCFGSGVAGVGALFNDGGESRFRSVSLSQGFGMFGFGALLDSGGGDEYRTDLYGQGSARTQGLGWLVAQKGGNVFRCEGLGAGRSSYSQGYAAGFANPTLLSGGCGLLTSFGSENHYIGGSSCQAAAEQGGVGSMYDLGGNGTRSATEKAQGFADMEAGAFLYDLGGDSSFSCQGGACQAFGNRLSTAFVLSKGDHNLWASQDGHPGSGFASSVGIFLNEGQDSVITGEPGIGHVTNGLSSVGLFCGMNEDVRSLTESPLGCLVRGSTGIVYDGMQGQLTGGMDAAPNPIITGSSNPATPMKDLLAQASSSDVFQARSAVVQLSRSEDRTAAGTAVALLDANDLLVRRAVLALLAKFPAEASTAANSLLAKADEESQRTAIKLLGSIGSPEALDRIGKLLATGSRGVQIECLEALNGRVPDAYIPKISELRNSVDSLIRSAARSVYVDR